MRIYQLATIITLIAFSFILSGCGFVESDENLKEININTSTGSYKYLVEIADDREERMLGLMHRDNLDETKGMLFIYPDERRTAFWMKNMKFPLDMIFMDKNWKIVDYFENVPPCESEPCDHYIPSIASQYILEINAGLSDEIMLARGDIADFKE